MDSRSTGLVSTASPTGSFCHNLLSAALSSCVEQRSLLGLYTPDETRAFMQYPRLAFLSAVQMLTCAVCSGATRHPLALSLNLPCRTGALMFACLFKTLRPHSFVNRPSGRSGLRVHVAASANSAKCPPGHVRKLWLAWPLWPKAGAPQRRSGDMGLSVSSLRGSQCEPLVSNS